MKDDRDAVVRGFEAVMFERAAAATVGAKEGIDEISSAHGLDFMLRQMAVHSGDTVLQKDDPAAERDSPPSNGR